ncbi:MAG TPA: glycosyltransferase family 2 protein [Candidatus Limnocylindrales bacterium]|nr:glycosyltransferase family 2 protein [Candidatus Limnocylindrales bacterium]
MAWVVLSFDFYWLYKAVALTVSVLVTFLRIRRVAGTDWGPRLERLADPTAGLRLLGARLDAVEARVALLESSGQRRAAAGGRRTVAALRQEQRELQRLVAGGVEVVDPGSLIQAVLVPTYTEPYATLEATVRALDEAAWPVERKIVAIITRASDGPGRENVARLQETFAGRFGQFIHILDPLEPGIVVGKSSAMACGGRQLYRLLHEQGLDPRRVIVTDLDSDYRVHPAYFHYLAYRFASDPDRARRLYQPVPMFHNNLWQVPFLVRLVAVGATEMQMWRSLDPERLVSFSSYAVALETVHEAGYWATDAIPEDSRFYWRAFFRFAGQFRAEPLFIPIYGDAVRAQTYLRTLVQQYLQIRRWAWGVTDIPYFVGQSLRHPEIPLGQRLRRLAQLWWDHLQWALAPFVLVFGTNLPLLLNPAFRETTLGQNLPFYAALMLTFALCLLVLLIYIEDAIAPPRPAEWGMLRRLGSYLGWLALPISGLVFTLLPALDAQTRLLAGRYLEYRVTEKA